MKGQTKGGEPKKKAGAEELRVSRRNTGDALFLNQSQFSFKVGRKCHLQVSLVLN